MGKSDLVTLLKSIEVAPSRQLGQNFLVDDNLSRWIVDQLEIESTDTVIEVGPGTGALTQFLIGNVDRLVLVEKDTRLANHLGSLDSSIEVVNQDAVQYDKRSLFLEDGVKFIGNLPYSAGTEIIRNFLTQPTPFTKAVVMLQKEVCDRICAKPGSKSYGVLSLMIQSEWEVTLLKTVGTTDFYPQPEVHSSIIRLEPRPSGDVPPFSPQFFREHVKRGFSQRRKQLRNNLGIEKSEWENICRSLDLSLTSRAEELSLLQWIALSNHLGRHPAAEGGQSSEELFDIVDENDNVLRQATRGETHREKLLHRAVHIFVFNKSGELYLQKRSHLKDTHAEKWDSSASGHVDSGEEYHTSAVRELQEEIMVTTKDDLIFVGKLAASSATDQEFVGLFRCNYQGKIRTHGNEIATGGYFPVDFIAEWIERRPEDFARGFIECFRFYLGQRND